MGTHQDIDIPWSDLRLVLALQREGTLRAAAKALRLSHPTVSRRIAELQSQLGVQLFEREGRVLRLTDAGEDLAQTAARIEVEVDGLGRRIAGRDHRLEGRVRISLSPSMFAALSPALADFGERYPGIELELTTGLGFASLTRREADVVIRQTNAPDETLVGRRLSLFEGAAYVSRSLQARMLAAGEDDPRRWPWVDWDEAHRHHSSAGWMREHIDPAQIVVRCDNSLSMYQLVQSGIGAGYVPTMLAAPDPELLRIEPRDAFGCFQREIWVLTHADLRNTGRVQATVRWLGEQLRVEGGGPWQGLPLPKYEDFR